MVTLVNRAKMATSTTGTGTITLGSAVTGFQTFADAGITNGMTVRYVIENGDNFEIGSGTYTSSGTTLSRTVTESSNSDSALNLSGSSEVFLTAIAADIDAKLDKSGGTMTGVLAMGSNAITTSSTVDGRDLSADGTKLDAIEASATADQTASEIRALVESASDSNVFTDADHSKLNAIEASATADQTDAEIRAAVEAASDSNVFTDADHTKLNGIEASADVTDATNVTAAGALMDSEVTNLAEVKAFDASDYATAAQGTLATNALPKSGGAMTGAITTNSTFDGRDVATDGTKLDGIESNATADQTDAEIRAAVEAASDSNVFTDADHSKLNAIEASADVTDATNVTAAGALMDSEVTNLAQVKAFDSSDYATAAQGTLATNALPKSGGTMTGDLILGDDVKLEVGSASGGDLQIYHDGSDSYIKEDGTGNLIIAADDFRVTNVAVDETMIAADTDGGVILYNNGSAKVATDAEGANVTGLLDVSSRVVVAGGSQATTTSDGSIATAGGLSVTKNIVVGGTVDGRDIATDGTKLDGIEANATADQTKSDIEGLGIDLPAGNLTGTIAAARLSTATTQAESDDSTKIATTAYVTDKITTLIGGAPSTLNDLNELAAAINDDANYNSTLTTALGTKLPKAGGTMTGAIEMGSNAITSAGVLNFDADTQIILKDDGVNYGTFYASSNDFYIQSLTQDKDIVFYGNDGGSGITALTLDMSDAGKAIFNSGVKTGNNGYINIPTASSGNANISFDGSDFNITSNSSSANMNFQTNSSTKMTINSAGAATFTGDVQSQGLYVGATNTSYDFYNNGTSYLNGATTVDDTLTANAIVVDDITINGSNITDSGTLYIDVGGDIHLDAGGSDISLQSGAAEYGKFNLTSNSLNIHSSISDGDIVFKGNDGGSTVTALTLDMSDAGNATFNDGATFGSGIVAPRIKSTQVTVTVNSPSTALDFSTSNNFMVNMTASTTFSFSNIAGAVGCSGNIIIVQNATGGYSFELPSEAKTPVNGATIVQNTGANEISVLSYYVMSSSQVLVNYIGDFA